jgi:hypothetical protein
MDRKSFIRLTTTVSLGFIVPTSAFSKTENAFNRSLPSFLTTEFGELKTNCLLKLFELIRPEYAEDSLANIYSEKLKLSKQTNTKKYMGLKSKFDNVLSQIPENFLKLSDSDSYTILNKIKNDGTDNFASVRNSILTIYYSNANPFFRKTWSAIGYDPVFPCCGFEWVKPKQLVCDTEVEIRKHFFEKERIAAKVSDSEKNQLISLSCK